MITCQLRYIVNQRSTILGNLQLYKHVHQLLDEIPCSKPALICPVNQSLSTCLRANLPFDAFKKFKELLKSGQFNVIEEVTLALALKGSCGNSKQGTQVHKFAITSGLMSFITVPNSLMNMYSKSGQFDKALCIFEGLNDPNMVSWNTLLSGFQRSEEAFNFVLRMNLNGVLFDAVTCTTALSFCFDLDGFLFGLQLHALVMKSAFDCDVNVANALIAMYSRWKRLDEAQRMFDEMPNRDLVSWTAILSGYSQDESSGLEAIWTFIEMVKQRMYLDYVPFTVAVSVCARQRSLEVGRQTHGLCIKEGYGTHVSVCNVLMSMYANCEVVEDAKSLFRRMNECNVISWTTMISIDDEYAIHHFNEMRSNHVSPNEVTFVGLIRGITVRKLVKEGQMVHACCVKSNFLSESKVCSSLITMYANFELIQDSIKVFEKLESKGIDLWNALISGYSQNGMFTEALRTYLSAIKECKPDQYTFGSVLNAIGSCGHISLKHGQRCHLHLIKAGFDTNPIVSNALLDMYAKRGSISEARKVFKGIPQKIQSTWTSIISAHARHGDYNSVIASFQEMKNQGVKPDSITFLSTLTACGRNGTIDMGQLLFKSMLREYKIKPSSKHYSCVVDMLARADRLEEAERLMDCSPEGPELSMLQSLLWACRIHGDVDMGEKIADILMEMEPNESGSYVLMSNLYAEKGKWEMVAEVRKMMRQRGVRKEVGFSWVDTGDINSSLYLHGFSSGDRSHKQSEEICKMAECLGLHMKLL
ncbi:pentatricopeptide repeat-containing protein At4g32430, mitochondrial-like [Hibiscus syriacus]|uniref:pentatricopeptide repeat-containing protein At4g32430, mitochondrial-like n=1 Tax=Hibiscus syriacus TaxID=106335 RepID=UPI001920B7B7|nr:pentatricopeptide repeat-containing protein At4g32430, mitochondrial-like [Hibiscus syriacus]